ncbi:MATE family efflux transporter [Litchfieldia alkalitelluris]|uniref:MATE family efflux transporter n=1 Tax=Litchfieldia alkalitelluris TaxID=304268 RepID=UPI000997D6A8|nr:MATE family efflux transporter [Litchfieldia alkalitelluris]
MRQVEVVEQPKFHALLNHRSYLILAIPLVISGLSTPILGAVDTAVVGQLSNPSLIGGVAVGSLIFNIMYWLLGFLRVSTTGFTAQAFGAEQEQSLAFIRPMLIAALFGIIFILFQYPIVSSALSLMGTTEAVSEQTKSYFYIRIWGAPFTLASYVMIGWMMGMSKIRQTLYIQLFMNGLNIVLDIVFVLGLGFGVKGVATATLISEISAVILGLLLILKSRSLMISPSVLRSIFDSKPFIRMLQMNRDLFLRTICLLTMTFLFTKEGAKMGEVTLAANAILLQIHYIMAYFFGGFANASSILTGRAIAEKNQLLYKQVLALSAIWGLITAVFLSMTIIFSGTAILGIFTPNAEVNEVASQVLFWVIIFPIFGFWGLQLEGIFSGATRAGEIRNSISLALIVFIIALTVFVPYYENDGIWIAFVLFSLSRSIFLWLFVPKLRDSFL